MTGELLVPRARPRAVLLDDGTVLVVGGQRSGAASDEVVDPRTLRGSPAPKGASARMIVYDSTARRFVATTKRPEPGPFGELALTTKQTLRVGGERSVDLGRYGWRPESIGDVRLDGRPPAKLAHDRTGAVLTLLLDGRVAVTGGYTTGMDYSWEDTQEEVAPIEVVDVARMRVASAGRLAVPRWSHAAVLLRDGSVLVLGGERHGASALADVERVVIR